MQLSDELIQRIKQSRKYQTLYEPTIRRVVEDVAGRYPAKQVEKTVKTNLHQMWAAYLTPFDYKKIYGNLVANLTSGTPPKVALVDILRLQSSTRERIPVMGSFYEQIFAVTGMPRSIVDHACGLNALSYSWMDTDAQYVGYDIDAEQIGFMNQVFGLLGIGDKVEVRLGDSFINDFQYADICFLLKVLPLLEHQKKGCTLEVLKSQKCKFLVASYPTQSLSGKNRGMGDFYDKYFRDLIKNEPWEVTKLNFETELVFILKN